MGHFYSITDPQSGSLLPYRNQAHCQGVANLQKHSRKASRDWSLKRLEFGRLEGPFLGPSYAALAALFM